MREKSEAVNHSTGKNLVFIVGCPRSGTTYLQQLLASHPKAKSGRESYLFLSYISPQLRAWRKEFERKSEDGGVGLGCYLTNEEFLRDLREYMFLLMHPMISSLQSDEFFVEKTPSHALCIRDIIELLPDSKIVSIIRDCRDVVASLLNMSRKSTGNWAPGSPAQAAKYWVQHVAAVRSQTASMPTWSIMEVRYEKLLEDPVVTMNNVIRFLGREWEEGLLLDAVKKNSPAVSWEMGTKIPIGGEFKRISGREFSLGRGSLRKAKVGSWRSELSLSEKFAVWRVARKAMKDNGYPWKYPWN